jgi:hypothetical protein
MLAPASGAFKVEAENKEEALKKYELDILPKLPPEAMAVEVTAVYTEEEMLDIMHAQAEMGTQAMENPDKVVN